MKLTELADQYLAQAEALLQRIHRLKLRLEKLGGNDRLIMKRRIMSLYCDTAECRRLATHLKNHSKGEAPDEQNSLQP